MINIPPNAIESPMAETTKDANTPLSRKVRRMLFGLGLHSWEQLMLSSLGVAGLVAIAVFITTASVVILQRAENARLTQKLADAKVELARLGTSRYKLLTPFAIDSIVEKIKPFAGTKFDVGHESSGREQWNLSWNLEQLFPKAGWIFIDWEGPQKLQKVNWTKELHWYGVANVANVAIELNPESREELLPASNALVTALRDVGIAAAVEDHPIGAIATNAKAIHVLIGGRE
jgi:hypothetical protein